MKKILLLFIFLSSPLCLADEYSNCILENMRGVNDSFAAKQIKIACRKNTLHVPAKCKNLDINFYEGVSEKPSFEMFECINHCLDSSYWSKHFGDCKE